MQNFILSPIDLDVLKQSLSEIVQSELAKAATKSTEEKLLSPSEVCAVFQPKISKTTLAKWTKEGYLVQQKIGGRGYYKFSDVISAGKTIKKYKRN
jgi:hypothetical protein